MSFKKKLSVIDMETLGLFDDSIILSIGLTCSNYDDEVDFKSLVENGLHIKLSIKEQKEAGRTFLPSTVQWWSNQSEQAKSVLKSSPDDVSILMIPKLLEAFYASHGTRMKDVDLYDRNCFDIKKLSHLFQVNLDYPDNALPWDRHGEFEIATALRFMGFDRYAGIRVEDIEGATYHNALHDAAVDHIRLLKAMNE